MLALRTKLSFFDMLIGLLDNFLHFFKHNPLGHFSSGANIFNFAEYLQCFKDSRQSFMELFSKTQNFVSFIEGVHKKEKDLSYFIEGARLNQTLGKIGLQMHSKRIITQMSQNFNNVKIYV